MSKSYGKGYLICAKGIVEGRDAYGLKAEFGQLLEVLAFIRVE